MESLTIEEHKRLAYLLEKQRVLSMCISQIHNDEKWIKIHNKIVKNINSLKNLLDDFQLQIYPEAGIVYYGALKKYKGER